MTFERGSHVLDVGCGTGDVIEMISQRFECKGNGYDIDARRIAAALSRSKFATFKQSFFNPAEDPTSYDAALSLAVIEHVPDPVAHFRELAAGLKAGGNLFVLTPNASSLSFRFLRSWWRELLSIGEHIYLFTPQSLARCASHAGFKMEAFTSDFDFSRPRFQMSGLRSLLVSGWAFYREGVKRAVSLVARKGAGDILSARFSKTS